MAGSIGIKEYSYKKITICIAIQTFTAFRCMQYLFIYFNGEKSQMCFKNWIHLKKIKLKKKQILPDCTKKMSGFDENIPLR